MPPNSIIPRTGHPPFRFLLLDKQGRVLKPSESYTKGQRVPESLSRKALPIQIDGKIVALSVPIGDPIFTSEDRAYLALTQRALLTGFLAAAVLALLGGLFLGRRMSAALGEVTKAVRNMQPDGKLRLQIPVRSRDEIGILASALNRISAKLAEAHQTLRIQADEMRELSLRDPLTDLYNRRYFDEQVVKLYQQALRHTRPLTVVACDLDLFKQINDRYSHGIGDKVLRRVAQLLKDNTRGSDVIARYGGEEFVIACVDSTLAQTTRRCEELRRQIEIYPWHELHSDLKVTVSMGLSDALSLPGVEKMLDEADSRLYEAKNSGRNRIMPQAA